MIIFFKIIAIKLVIEKTFLFPKESNTFKTQSKKSFGIILIYCFKLEDIPSATNFCCCCISGLTANTPYINILQH